MKKGTKFSIIFYLLMVGCFSASASSAHFYANKVEGTPDGSGFVYIERGGSTDQLSTSISDDQWKPVKNGASINISLSSSDKGDGKIDNSTSALNVYFYAKTNPGYQFDGWYKDDKGAEVLEGSTTHYNSTGSTSTWNNGGQSTNPPASGTWAGYHYLRHVQPMRQNDNSSKNAYAKFSLIPRAFVLVPADKPGVSYTANSYVVTTSNITTSNITSDISLSIDYNPELYTFSGWLWSEGENGTQTQFATSKDATYVLNSNEAAARGLTTATRVYIRPDIREKASTIDVTYNDNTTEYETWADAFSAAKAEGVTGAIIKLKKEVSDISTIQIVDRPMTIDLNGHTISGAVNNMFTVNGTGASLTIKDGSSSKTGRISLSNSNDATTYAVTVYSGSALTIESGTVYNKNEKSDGTARGVEIRSGGTLILNGGNIEAQSLQNAYALINRGTTTINGGNLYAHTTSAATAVAFYNVGTFAEVNDGAFRAEAATTSAYGIQQNVDNTLTVNNAIVSVSAITSTAYALVRSNGKIVVNNGKYKVSAPSTIAPVNVKTNAQIELKGGVYSTYTNVRQCRATSYDCYELEEGEDYDAGYRFIVKSEEGHPRVCKVIEVGKTTYYESLADALSYVNNHPNDMMKIIMIAFEHTLTQGNYTLPPSATLVVPYKVDQTDATSEVNRVTSYSTPSVFRKLTLANGAHMEVYGTIEAGGVQNAQGQGESGAGVPSGPYGQIVMEQGSSMTLNNGAILYAWGFVTGTGEIDARRGSRVYEQFQMYDWKGGTIMTGGIGSSTSGLLGNDEKTFPVNQYFIQNVEASIKFRPGALQFSSTSVNLSEVGVVSCNVQMIGLYNHMDNSDDDIAMFLMDDKDDSEDTWVRKAYDVENDYQVYSVNSKAKLGSIIIDISGYVMNSQDYVLPITNNLKIHLLSGEMGIKQSTVLLPGSEIEVDKEATATIEEGEALYLYDNAQWDKYVYSATYAQQVRYVPSTGGKPNKRDGQLVSDKYVLNKPVSASINVHGTFDVAGALYTTEDGANIHSTIEDAGTIHFSVAAAEGENIYQATNFVTAYNEILGKQVPYLSSYDKPAASCTSARLKNGDEYGYSTTYGAYSSTVGTVAGQSLCFIDMDQDGHGEWLSLTTDECFVTDGNLYYAKPADYVALANGKTENLDHTYSSIDGTRLFILLRDEDEGCQWWEVEYEPESGFYYCDKNDTYYYYDEFAEEWLVPRYTVYWNNWNGTPLKDKNNDIIWYWLPYGTTPQFLGTTPKREKDDYYTYDFIGWSPALSPLTEDVTYIAQYERNDRMYTITWKDELGNTIESDYCKMGQIPECYNAPDMTDKEWSPAVSAVTGDQVYTLTAKNNDGPFDIKFVNWNWDGTDEHALKIQSVAKNATPVAPDDPEKDALADIAFDFAGWRAANNTVYASNAIPAATENAVYTATFTEKPITYTILWKNYDNSVLETDENVTPNTVPQYTGATPTKPSDDDNHYAFSGWSPAVVAATADATYTAQFASTPKDKVVEDGEETVEESKQQTVTNLTIKEDGKLIIPTTSRVNATNLYLEATSDASGQLITNANTSINVVNAYYDLTLNTYARHWHSFGVPWMVDLNTNPLTEVETGRTLTIGRDYDIMYYNGEKRAQEGVNADCWEYVQDNGNTLTPGQGYMIAFTSAVKTLRFVKAAGAPVIFSSAMSVAANYSGTETDKGINAIANPMAYHAKLDVGVGVGQIHVSDTIGSDEYTEVNIENRKFIVGKAVYVKVPAAKSVVIAPAGSAGDFTPVAAPARRAKKQDEKKYMTLEDYYTVSLTPSNGSRAAKVYVLPMEEKDDAFITGQDLAKMSMSTKKAQIWVNRYESKLALNTTAPVNDIAQFPISVYAPEAGEYTISLQSQPDEEYTVYLTQDGRAFWNLSMDGCSLELAKGTNKSYGLRLVRSKAPQTATGIEEALVDAQGEIKKVIINDKVFIIRGDQVYSIDGQMVK